MAKVLVTRHVPESCMDYLRDQGYEVVHTMDISEQNICKLIADADALLAREVRSTKAVIDAAPKLKIISRFGIGTDTVDMEYATQNGIWVGVTPLASPRSVAEHAIALLMACAKNIYSVVDHVKKNDWLYRNTLNGSDIEGKTLGLIGLGRIGRFVAQMANGLGMKVLAFDQYLDPKAAPDGVEVVPTMFDLLQRSDFVSVHCPLTSETKNLISTEQFAAMKQGAVLINTARGPIVDEDALYHSLKSGHLRAAGLDVCQVEPPRADNPLLGLDNCIITAHTAAVTDEAMYRMGMHAALNIDDVLKGNEPRWPANRPNPVR